LLRTVFKAYSFVLVSEKNLKITIINNNIKTFKACSFVLVGRLN